MLTPKYAQEMRCLKLVNAEFPSVHKFMADLDEMLAATAE